MKIEYPSTMTLIDRNNSNEKVEKNTDDVILIFVKRSDDDPPVFLVPVGNKMTVLKYDQRLCTMKHTQQTKKRGEERKKKILKQNTH